MHSGIHWPGGVCKLMNLVRAMMIFVGKQRCAVIMKLSVVFVSAVLSFRSQNRSAIF